MLAKFRIPERMGPFSTWISTDIYPLAESARETAGRHRQLIAERLPMDPRPEDVAALNEDQELLDSTREFAGSQKEIRRGLEREQSPVNDEDAPLVHRLFVASSAEWALDLHYQMRKMTKVREGSEARWWIFGRAWEGERKHDTCVQSVPFPHDDKRAGELALLEVLGLAYASAISGLLGWPSLDPVPMAHEAAAC